MAERFVASDVALNGLPEREGPRKKVIIVGAGMAGLIAAYELLKQGHELHILEARNRAGGRVYTLRGPFAEGLHAEAGAIVEMLREDLGRFYTDLYQIRGGTDRLPNALYEKLKPHVRFGAVVTALDQTPDGVVAHYKTPAGRFEARGDFMIITVPFAVLRHIQVIKPFSRAKQKAIRQLHYDASAKIFLQCKRRFWEEDEGIFGGGTITDLAIRNMYYPEHGRETGRGVIRASYTWSEDAERWGSLSPDDRIDQAIESAIVVGVQLPKRGLQECNAHRAPTRLLQQR